MNVKLKYVLIAGIGLLVLCIGIVFFSSFSSHTPSTPISLTPTQSPLPTSSFYAEPSSITGVPSYQQPTVPFQRDTFLDKQLAPNSEPTTTALTTQEQTYANAKPQSFPEANTTSRGTLIVTSDTPNTTVTIDLSGGSESGANTISSNTTPFKMTRIPAGYYVVNAVQNTTGAAYIMVIEPNKITRLHINLKNSQGSPGD